MFFTALVRVTRLCESVQYELVHDHALLSGAELSIQSVELLDPLFEAWVRGEQRRKAERVALCHRWCEVKSIERSGTSDVFGWNSSHFTRDLDQS